MELISLKESNITEVVPEGLKTEDGKIHDVDVIVFATGFDSITGGITQIDIRGIDGQTVKDKWQNGVYSQLGMTTAGFPNLFYTYGPQAPTAFATGPSSAETQGSWIVECLKYL